MAQQQWKELADLVGAPTSAPQVVALLKSVRKRFTGSRADLKPLGISLEAGPDSTIARVTLWAVESAHAGMFGGELPLDLSRELRLESLGHPIVSQGPTINGVVRDVTLTDGRRSLTLQFDVFAASKTPGQLTSIVISAPA